MEKVKALLTGVLDFVNKNYDKLAALAVKAKEHPKLFLAVAVLGVVGYAAAVMV